jgi:hypothetical protein
VVKAADDAAAPQLDIVPAETPEQLADARLLFEEYAGALGLDLCFQNFDDELASLPGEYAAPGVYCCWRWSTDNWPAAVPCARCPTPTTPTPAK